MDDLHWLNHLMDDLHWLNHLMDDLHWLNHLMDDLHMEWGEDRGHKRKQKIEA
jgi:hypothetical protein